MAAILLPGEWHNPRACSDLQHSTASNACPITELSSCLRKGCAALRACNQACLNWCQFQQRNWHQVGHRRIPRLLISTSSRAHLGAEAKDEDVLGIPNIIHLCQLLLQLSLHRNMQHTSSARLLLECSLSGQQVLRSTQDAADMQLLTGQCFKVAQGQPLSSSSTNAARIAQYCWQFQEADGLFNKQQVQQVSHLGDIGASRVQHINDLQQRRSNTEEPVHVSAA